MTLADFPRLISRAWRAGIVHQGPLQPRTDEASRLLRCNEHRGAFTASSTKLTLEAPRVVRYSEGTPEVMPFALEALYGTACGRRASMCSPATGFAIDVEKRPSPAIGSVEHGPRAPSLKVLGLARQGPGRHRPAAGPSESERRACMPQCRSITGRPLAYARRCAREPLTS